MRKNDRAFTARLERRENMKQESVVAVLRWREAIRKSLEFIFNRIESAAPRFGGKWRIGDNEVKGLQLSLCRLEVWRRERIVFPDFRRWAVMENHIHPCQGARGIVHFLTVDRQIQSRRALGFVVRLQQQ